LKIISILNVFLLSPEQANTYVTIYKLFGKIQFGCLMQFQHSLKKELSFKGAELSKKGLNSTAQRFVTKLCIECKHDCSIN